MPAGLCILEKFLKGANLLNYKKLRNADRIPLLRFV